MIGVIGMSLQMVLLYQRGNTVPAVFLMVGTISFIAITSVLLKKLFSDVKQGFPTDDERSKKVRAYAAGRAYFYSLFIWIALLAFHRYLDRDDILLMGLLGMALSFGVNWVILNKKKGLE
ncbi:hypothetical protein [Salinithrix halophila]|uniref:ATP synthase protein I n=1 Tax=Salinithrix halophila TaxID=1485204 RepID=A0ABV8JFF7_9BACL